MVSSDNEIFPCIQVVYIKKAAKRDPREMTKKYFVVVGVRSLFLKHLLHNAQGCINVICEGSSVHSTERVRLLMIFSIKIMVLRFYVDFCYLSKHI